MANDAIRKQYGIDDLVRQIPGDRSEFFLDYVPWPQDMDGWRRQVREQLRESENRSLNRTIWDLPQDPDSRVLIDVVECNSTPDAIETLADWLESNQLADVPKGPEALGLASFQHPEYAPPAIFFAKGNLSILATSFGRKPVDVLAIAQRLHSRLNEKPTGSQQPMSLSAEVERGKVRQDISLRFGLPIQKDPDGSVKFFVTGGTIFRREGQLVLRATTTGVIEVEAYLVEPGREAHTGRLTITIE